MSDENIDRLFKVLIYMLGGFVVFLIVGLGVNLAIEGYKSVYCFKNPTDLACKYKTDSDVRVKHEPSN